MCPLQISDFSPEVRSDVVEFFAEFEPLVLKITNDYDPEIFWTVYADCDEMRVLDERLREYSQGLGMSLFRCRERYSDVKLSESSFVFEPSYLQLSLPLF